MGGWIINKTGQNDLAREYDYKEINVIRLINMTVCRKDEICYCICKSVQFMKIKYRDIFIFLCVGNTANFVFPQDNSSMTVILKYFMVTRT